MKLIIPAVASATVFFKETFDDKSWSDRWVSSNWKKDEKALFEEKDGAIITPTDGKYYGLTASFDEFSNKDKDIYVQYEVMYTKSISCGGGYIKLGPKLEDPSEMTGESEYNIMFGPDKCGYDSRTHLIFRDRKGDKGNVLKTEEIKYKQDDNISHTYRLKLSKDNSVEVDVDGENVYKGNLKDDWKLLEDKEIPDPEDKKPDDWVDEEMMDDPEDKKPEDWVDEARIVDPEATKPDDWNAEEDGEWEAPMIDNPDYKGEWKAKRIQNEDYKGEWEQKRIPNPKYVDDNELYHYEKFGSLFIDLWQVQAGSQFDNFIITDDVTEADKLLELAQVVRKAQKDKAEEEEAKRAEEEAEAAEEKEMLEDEPDDDKEPDEEA